MRPSSAPEGVHALLFDLGNVLIDVDFARCARIWSAHAGVSAETLASRFQVDDAYRAYECGAMTTSDYFAALRRQLDIDLPDEVLAQGWQAIIQGEKIGLRSCLRRLKRRYSLYVLTNTNVEHEHVWSDRHRELLTIFDDVFVSSRMGCRKPDAEAFHKVARAIGEPLGKILFFDDAPENIDGARRCGMPGILVDTADTVRLWTERGTDVTNG